MDSYNDRNNRISGFFDDDDVAEELIDLYDIARKHATFIPVDPVPGSFPDGDGAFSPDQSDASDDSAYSSIVNDVFYFGDDSYDEYDGYEYDLSGDDEDEYDLSDDEEDEYDLSDDDGDEYDLSDDDGDEYDLSDDEEDEYDLSDDEEDEYDLSDDEEDDYDLSDDDEDEYDLSDDEEDEYDLSDDEEDEYDLSDDDEDDYDLSDDEEDEYGLSDDEEDDSETASDAEDDSEEYDDRENFHFTDSDEEEEYDEPDSDDDGEESIPADSGEKQEFDEDSGDDEQMGYYDGANYLGGSRETIFSLDASGYGEYEDEYEDEYESSYECDYSEDTFDDGLNEEAYSEEDFIDINSFLTVPSAYYAAQEAQSVYFPGQYTYEAPTEYHAAPEKERHSAAYYWAKRKTVGGWVKFAAKCFAVLLLAGIVSGVLYFNGLLNLIDFKAASDFEQYYNLSDTDYQDDADEETVYSTPVYYNESTTIEGFNESMIDIPKKDVLNILLIGTDVRGGTYKDRGNTDSMILVSLNTRDKNIRLTSFMRDMYVDIPGREWQRLNAAYAYGGPQLLFDTLKTNFDVDVDLYVRVNFANFRKIVNHVGGVDIELSEAEARYMNKYADRYKTDPVEAGWQHLDGAQALSYARCRKIDSDFNRTKRQRTVILALIKEIKGSSPAELNSLLNVFLPMIQTNMSKMQILSLMADGTRYLNSNIETLNVPIKNSWRSATIRKRSVLCPNFELNKTAITAHIYSTYHLDVENTKYQKFDIPS